MARVLEITNSLSYHNKLRAAQYDNATADKDSGSSSSRDDGGPAEEKTGNYIPIDKLMGDLREQAMERARLSQRGKPDGQQ